MGKVIPFPSKIILDHEDINLSTIGDTIRAHWPTRDQKESYLVLGKVVDTMRWKYSLSYSASIELFSRIVGEPVLGLQFDLLMQELGNND